MPQFSSVSDIWGSQSANANYHSVQVSLAQRMSHGLTLNLNYTYAKKSDDAGTMRSGWAIPGNLLISGQSWKANRIDQIDKREQRSAEPGDLWRLQPSLWQGWNWKRQLAGAEPGWRMDLLECVYLHLRYSAADYELVLREQLSADVPERVCPT